MRINRAAAVAVATAALSTAGLGTAVGSGTAIAAPPAANEAHLVGVVTYDPADPHVGYVQARYRCDYEMAGLWVSVKQSADRTADPALAGEGSGGMLQAATWLDSHRNPITCDGNWHTETFVVDQLEPSWNEGAPKQGELSKGEAWVQFCLTPFTESEEEPEGVTVKEFKHVRTA